MPADGHLPIVSEKDFFRNDCTSDREEFCDIMGKIEIGMPQFRRLQTAEIYGKEKRRKGEKIGMSEKEKDKLRPDDRSPHMRAECGKTHGQREKCDSRKEVYSPETREMIQMIDRLEENRILTGEEFIRLIDGRNHETESYLYAKARETARKIFGNQIYTRGLIEITNYCKNDCYYCGIRRSNGKAARYRLTKEDILICAAEGYDLGFRTFVLQGGEDAYFHDDRVCDIVSSLREHWPDCAVTLSIGEKAKKSYEAYFRAGADRYLLRHETADRRHYESLHPAEMSFEGRMRCLCDLKEIGYQVGAGFMVGSPGQTTACLAEDLLFLHDLKPHMVGIGPFLPHHDTPFGGEPAGSTEETLFLLGILRLMMPELLLPATTALGTASSDGRERGILAGANVVMPNLSPGEVRRKYMLYDGKVSDGAESAQARAELAARVKAIGYELSDSRGDSPVWTGRKEKTDRYT